MYRNDVQIPCWSVVTAAALGWAAYLDWRYFIAPAGQGAAEALSVGQIGLVAFALVFAVYGVMGLLSVWLEGSELRPGRHLPAAGRRAVAAALAAALGLSAVSGLFVNDILRSLETTEIHSASEGILFGTMAILSAVLLLLYHRYVAGSEVIAEDEHSEVPW